QPPGRLAPRWCLRRQNSQRDEAGKLAGRAADQIRVSDQPANGPSTRPRNPADAARARRRGDRMTRRLPRTGESSHERPRPARKERDTLGGTAHRAATMLVHFRETPYGLAMSLVETRRENGKVRHEHIASLGSIETPPS